VKGKESSGHGLGLAFVEAVVRAHGGTVSAGNRAEGGARLTITLPCTSESHEHAATTMGTLVG
jgi:signal transduction histidine kinase